MIKYFEIETGGVEIDEEEIVNEQPDRVTIDTDEINIKYLRVGQVIEAGYGDDDDGDDAADPDFASYAIDLGVGIFIFVDQSIGIIPHLIFDDEDSLYYTNDELTELWDAAGECTPESVVSVLSEFFEISE